MVIVDPEMPVGLGEAAALVAPRAAEGHGEERLLVAAQAVEIHAVEERCQLRITDDPFVEAVNGGVDAHHAAEPLVKRVGESLGHAAPLSCEASRMQRDRDGADTDRSPGSGPNARSSNEKRSVRCPLAAGGSIAPSS